MEGAPRSLRCFTDSKASEMRAWARSLQVRREACPPHALPATERTAGGQLCTQRGVRTDDAGVPRVARNLPRPAPAVCIFLHSYSCFVNKVSQMNELALPQVTALGVK